MSGFLLILRKDLRPPAHQINGKMLMSLRSFGVDRDNLVNDGRFTAIWTHDVGYTPQDSFEFQPVMIGERWLLMFLGFLMHREELVAKLGLGQIEAAQITDSALVAHAWEKWGSDCLDELHGPFSFVVADLVRVTLFAARGQERGCSLYYHGNDERLILATSTKPIFCDPAITRQIDELRIADALVLNHEDTARSYFKGISLVPAGHTLSADPERVTIRRFYSLDRVQDIRFPNEGDYVEAAKELLEKAVASTMRASQKPAVSLSSGLDSSAVAVTMLDQTAVENHAFSPPVRAFTSVPSESWDRLARPGWEGDESGPVKALAKQYPGLEVEFVGCQQLPFDHGLDLFQSYADMPILGASNLHWGVELAERCRQSGARVMLSGSGGNAALSLSIRDIQFGQWFRDGRWINMVNEHTKTMQLTNSTNWVWLRKLLGAAMVPNLPDWLYDRYRLAKGNLAGFSAHSAINPSYADELGLPERMATLGWDHKYRRPRTRRELMRIMIQRGGRDQSGALTESFKVMTGVQARDPLGDRRILEFCYAIPDDQFYQDGIDRRLIKRVMARRLPTEVFLALRGEQAADWHSRLSRDLPRIEAEIDRLVDDPAMARRLDIPRIKRCLQQWPKVTPVSAADHPDVQFMRFGIVRAIAAARFINGVEGKN